MNDVTTESQPLSLGTRIVRGAAAAFAINLLSNIFLFAGQLLIPRMLSRPEYAQYTVSISFVALMALAADLGMNPLFTRLFAQAEEQVAKGEEDERGRLLGSALTLRLGMSIIVALLVLFIGPMLYPPSMVANMAILLLTLLISSRILVVRSVGESVLRGIGKYYLTACFALADAVGFAVLLFYGRYHHFTLTSVLWVYALCNIPGFLLLTLSISRWLLREGVRLSIDTALTSRILRTSLPLAIGTACLTIHSQIDSLLLDKLSTPSEVSSYGATIRLNAAVAPISVVLAAVTAPEITRLLHRGDQLRSKQLTDLSLRVLLVIACAIALLLSVSSTPLVTLLLGVKYSSAAPLLAWTGWMLLPIFIATFLLEASVAAGLFWAPTVYAGFIMIAVIFGDVLLIPSLGAAGAMASKLVALSLGCGLLVWLSRNSDHLDSNKFASAFWRVTVSAGSSLMLLWLIRGFGLSNWPTVLLVLSTFFAAVHILRVLSLRELLALLKKIRLPASQNA